MNKPALTIPDLTYIVEHYYAITPVQSINPILSGASSECFHIVTPHQDYILKDVELDFMNHPHLEPTVHERLLKCELPVSHFIQSKDHQYIVSYKEHTFHLQTFIKGTILPLHTAPSWFLEESACLLGKIHNALNAIPMLPSGIGPHFFEFVNTESALKSYTESLTLAHYNQDFQNVHDLEYRISLLERLKTIEFNLTEFTYRNTHGDYFISQILCANDHISGVIDFTSCCTHPACWELIRSYSFADPKCKSGALDTFNLITYIENYLKHSSLNPYDIEMMPYLYFYQLGISDYFKQYYDSTNSNRQVLAYYAHWSTLLLKWLEKNADHLSEALCIHFNSLKSSSQLANSID